MSYLLDTSACIGIMRKSAIKTVRRFAATDPFDISICSVVLFELIYGAMRSSRPSTELEKVVGFCAGIRCLDFDNHCATKAAEIRTRLEKQGQKIGSYDIQIAGTAIRHDLILVTGNLSEFTRVAGLRVENWEQ